MSKNYVNFHRKFCGEIPNYCLQNFHHFFPNSPFVQLWCRFRRGFCLEMYIDVFWRYYWNLLKFPKQFFDQKSVNPIRRYFKVLNATTKNWILGFWSNFWIERLSKFGDSQTKVTNSGQLIIFAWLATNFWYNFNMNLMWKAPSYKFSRLC